ncbi:hypothetical protein BFS06_12420 [Clostridium perfringens]|uniref:Ig-like domain repeat protein n=1 Tax=Clostridium perfringens TaxID=1502 RepID=UPI00103F9288|nr:Ig-like domain repeat protein [Clostridium perfringens]TBX15006.1 hypothetical protein BFS06_12420 [Clostridium perfringens]
MNFKKVMSLITCIGITFLLSSSINVYANDKLSGVNLKYNKVSDILGDISINAKTEGNLIKLPSGNYVKTMKNTDDKTNIYSVNYQVSNPNAYSFIVKNNNKEYIEDIVVDDIKGKIPVVGKNTIELKLHSEDITSKTTGVSLSNDGKTWSEYIPYSEKTSWTLPDTNGTHTVYAKFKDKAGNESKPTPLSIYLDKEGPKVNFTINNGEELTNKSNVILKPSINDMSEIKTIYLSNDSSNWKTYPANTKEITWTLDEKVGKKEIYMKAEDKWGNISSPVFKQIELDNEKPTGEILINNGDKEISNKTVKVHLTFNDNGTGIKQARLIEGVKSIELTEEQIKNGFADINWTFNNATNPQLSFEITDMAGNTCNLESKPISLIISKIDVTDFKLYNMSDSKNIDKVKPVSWGFKAQPFIPGGSVKIEMAIDKPNIGKNTEISGSCTISILNDNGYTKTSNLNIEKEDKLDNRYVVNFDVPKDAPIGSKVYFSSVLTANITKDDDTIETQKNYFPIENSQAEIGYISESIKNSLKFNKIY